MWTNLPEGAKPAKILFVEDEASLRIPLCEFLHELGLTVVEVANADDALVRIRLENHIELVFTDVRMPGSMNGLALAKQLKIEFPQVKIVILPEIPVSTSYSRALFLFQSLTRSVTSWTSYFQH